MVIEVKPYESDNKLMKLDHTLKVFVNKYNSKGIKSS